MHPRPTTPLRQLTVNIALAATLVAALAAALGPASAQAAPAPSHATPAGTASGAAAGATVSGIVSAAGDRHGLVGMPVRAVAPGSCPAGQTCGAETVSGAGGAYALTGLAPGVYTLDVVDGSTAVAAATVTITDPAQSTTVDLRLGPPAVPAGTVARNARRDLAWLNAERVRDGSPGGVLLNPRWSAECAGHDAYERANHVLDPTEDPTALGASAGGAWAGLNSALAEDRWTRQATPWENAPIHLLALLAPSLSVTGIDDESGLQCAVTSPGMVRAPGRTDTLRTYPAPGAKGIPDAELARESPFVPGQFAGLAADRTTGRELFVYLNRAGQTGQAAVDITRATLTRAGHPVAVRWVDNATRTIGPYLAGGIVIPVDPLRPATTYRATVAVRGGTRTLTRSWSFTTR